MSYRLQILHGNSYGLSNQLTKYKSTKNAKNDKNPKNVKSTKSTKVQKNLRRQLLVQKKQNKVKQPKYQTEKYNCANFAYKIGDRNGILVFIQNLCNYPGKMSIFMGVKIYIFVHMVYKLNGKIIKSR